VELEGRARGSAGHNQRSDPEEEREKPSNRLQLEKNEEQQGGAEEERDSGSPMSEDEKKDCRNRHH